MSTALEVHGLTVAYRSRREPGALNVVVQGVDFALETGTITGLAGESGCGKSTAALAAIGFDVPASIRLAGRCLLGGVDLATLRPGALRAIWGTRVAYVSQDAAASLSPLRRVGDLIAEPIRRHHRLDRPSALRKAATLLENVGIPDPAGAIRRYPHEFSGGQQQRIALALALSCGPEVLILDEPTTGLDVTTQAQIMELVTALVRDTGTAGLAVSHDLALLAAVCDHVAVMYAGEIVESGPARDVLGAPLHPYSGALVDSIPRVEASVVPAGIPGLPPTRATDRRCAFAPRCRFATEACTDRHPPLESASPLRRIRCLRTREIGVVPPNRRSERAARAPDARPLLVVENLICRYKNRGVLAVEGVSLAVAPGETLGIVGESGSGKSTLLRAIAGLHPPQGGRITFRESDLGGRAAKRPRPLRRAIQLVFQHPDSALNPRHTIGSIIERPLVLFRPDLDRRQRKRTVAQWLDEVRLEPEWASRLPHELSGGQKQRVALARAFVAEPQLILCDEVVSALDVSVQATVLELLLRLASQRRTALLFVTHDLAVVRAIADRVCVMRHGVIREAGSIGDVFESPQDEYTRQLLASVPRLAESGARFDRPVAATATSSAVAEPTSEPGRRELG